MTKLYIYIYVYIYEYIYIYIYLYIYIYIYIYITQISFGKEVDIAICSPRRSYLPREKREVGMILED